MSSSTTQGKKIDRAQQLAARPLRAATAEIERSPTGSARLMLPIKSRGWLFRTPAGAAKRFELDEIGLLVWDQCDGETSVEQLIGAVAERYQLNLREAEVATMKFLEMLARRRLIEIHP